MSTDTLTKAEFLGQIPAVGEIPAPERLYSKEGLKRAAGIGHEQLLIARQSGLVKAIRCGIRVWFKGSEIIDWIVSHGGEDAGSR